MKKISPFIIVGSLFVLAGLHLRGDNVKLAEFKNHGFTYGYEGWKDLAPVQSISETSVRIHGTAAGGVGLIFDRLQDASGTKFLVIKLKGATIANEDSLNVKLFDAEGHWSQWTIKASDIPTESYGTIKLLLDKPVTKNEKGADLEELKQVQIQGTFNPAKSVDIELVSIEANDGTVVPASDKP